MIEVIFGFDILASETFGGRNIWQAFFLIWLDLGREFLGVFNTICRLRSYDE